MKKADRKVSFFQLLSLRRESVNTVEKSVGNRISGSKVFLWE